MQKLGHKGVSDGLSDVQTQEMNLGCPAPPQPLVFFSHQATPIWLDLDSGVAVHEEIRV